MHNLPQEGFTLGWWKSIYPLFWALRAFKCFIWHGEYNTKDWNQTSPKLCVYKILFCGVRNTDLTPSHSESSSSVLQVSGFSLLVDKGKPPTPAPRILIVFFSPRQTSQHFGEKSRSSYRMTWSLLLTVAQRIVFFSFSLVKAFLERHGPETKGVTRYVEVLHVLWRQWVYFCYIFLPRARLSWACLFNSEKQHAQPAPLYCKLRLEDLQQY